MNLFLSEHAGMVGLLFFLVIWVAIIIWAYLPRNKDAIESHKHIPLED